MLFRLCLSPSRITFCSLLDAKAQDCNIPGPATFLHSEDFLKGNNVPDQKEGVFASQPKIWSFKQASTAQYGTWRFKISPKNYFKLYLEEKQYSESFSEG